MKDRCCDRDRSEVELTPKRLNKGIYVDDKKGCDQCGDGSRCNPFKTGNRAIKASRFVYAPLVKIHFGPGTYTLTENMSYRNYELIGTISDTIRTITLNPSITPESYTTSDNIDPGNLLDLTPPNSDKLVSSLTAGVLNNTFWSNTPVYYGTNYNVKQMLTTVRIECDVSWARLAFIKMSVHFVGSSERLDPPASFTVTSSDFYFYTNGANQFISRNSRILGNPLLNALSIIGGDSYELNYSAIHGIATISNIKLILYNVVAENLQLYRLDNINMNNLIHNNRLKLDGCFGTGGNLYPNGLNLVRSTISFYEQLTITPPTFDGIEPCVINQSSIKFAESSNIVIQNLGLSSNFNIEKSYITYAEGSSLIMNTIEGYYAFYMTAASMLGNIRIGITETTQTEVRIFNINRGSRVVLSETSFEILPQGDTAVLFEDVDGLYPIPDLQTSTFSITPTIGQVNGTLSGITRYPNLLL